MGMSELYTDGKGSEEGCTPAQLALAWVLHRGPDVVPIPGTTRSKHLEENAEAAAVELSDDELARIDEVIPAHLVAGTRYPEAGMARVGV